jgi:hypothetical protein
MSDSMENKKESVLGTQTLSVVDINFGKCYIHHTVYQKLCGFSRI